MIIRGKRVPPATSPAGGTPRVTPQRRAARNAAREAAQARYLPLVCGHMVAREIADRYSALSPIVKDWYCEIHDNFYDVKLPAAKAATQDCLCRAGECLHPDNCVIPF